MKKLWLVFSQSVTVLLAILWLGDGRLPQWLHVVYLKEVPASIPAPVSYRDAIARAAPSVVHIYAGAGESAADNVLSYFFRPARRQETLGVGSGVIVSSDGYVLTNNHVIAGDKIFQVLLSDGRRFPARFVGTDPESDLAVLKIESSDVGLLPTMALAKRESLAVGDVVFAIGNPYGFSQSVTSGIISALDRTFFPLSPVDEFIQTDVVVNPGNSGGALINAHGALIGIINAIYSNDGNSKGITFAIPIDRARETMTQLIEKGRVDRGWIGAWFREVEGRVAKAFHLKNAKGVLIAGFAPDSPAAKAGLQKGDIVLAINAQEISDFRAAIRAIKKIEPGNVATLKIQRGLEEMTLEVKVAKRPPRRHSAHPQKKE